MENDFEGVKLVIPGSQPTPPRKEDKEEDNLAPAGVIDLSGLGEDPQPPGEPASPKPKKENEEDTPSIYSALVKELAENGILDVDQEEEPEIKSTDDLIELFDKAVNSRVESTVNEFKSSFSGAKKMFLEIEDYFDDETVAMRVAQDLDYYDRLNEKIITSNDKVQKDLFSRYLRMKGMSDSEVAEALKEAEALSKLEEKAKQAFPKLKEAAGKFIEGKKQEAVQREQEHEQKSQEFFNSLLEGVDATEEIIPGVQLTKRQKDAIKQGITKVVYEDPKTGQKLTELGHKQYTNPAGFERLIQFYNTLGLFNLTEKGEFKPDLGKLVKLTEKQVRKGLDELIKEGQRASGTGSQEGKKLNMSFWEEAFGETE
jgi:hypothetical protein